MHLIKLVNACFHPINLIKYRMPFSDFGNNYFGTTKAGWAFQTFHWMNHVKLV